MSYTYAMGLPSPIIPVQLWTGGNQQPSLVAPVVLGCLFFVVGVTLLGLALLSIRRLRGSSSPKLQPAVVETDEPQKGEAHASVEPGFNTATNPANYADDENNNNNNNSYNDQDDDGDGDHDRRDEGAWSGAHSTLQEDAWPVSAPPTPNGEEELNRRNTAHAEMELIDLTVDE